MSRPRKHSTGLVTVGRLPAAGRLNVESTRVAIDLGDWELAWRPEGRTPTFEQTTAPAPVGDRSDESLFASLTIDQSFSEVVRDPIGHRMVAARRVLHLFQTDLKHRGDRMAVCHFAEIPAPRLGATDPHRKAGRQQLRRALSAVRAGGGTDIRAAIVATAHMVPKGWPGPVVVVLLTDGEDGSSTAQLSAAVGQLPPGAVHVISIGDPLPTTWDDVPLGSTTVVPSMARPDEVEWAAAQAIYRALGLRWNGPQEPPGAA